MKLFRAFFLIYIFAIISIQSYAQSFSYSQIAESTRITPISYDDFNNDGINDIITLERNENLREIVYYQGNGSSDIENRFTLTDRLVAPEYVIPFVNGDFDGDGDIDLVSIEKTTNKLFMVRNDDGQFIVKKYGEIENYSKIWAGDYNNDGKADLFNDFNSSFNDDLLSVIEFENDTLSENFIVMSNEKYEVFDVIDLNNDGKAELFGYDKEEQILDIILLNSLDISNKIRFENFDYKIGQHFSDGLVDFDKNGNIDLVYKDNVGKVICIYDIEFGQTQHPQIIDSFDLSAYLLLFDFNLDGEKELLIQTTSICSIFVNKFYLYSKDGQSIQKTPLIFNDHFLGIEYLETDPITKKVICYVIGSNVKILGELTINDDTSVNYKLHTALNQWIAIRFHEVSSTDVNHDGNEDILYHLDDINSEIGVLYGNGDGSYAPREVIIDEVELPFKAKFADFNNDGSMDIMYYSSRIDKLSILYNTNGKFQEFTSFDSLISFYPCDFDSDGFTDFLRMKYIANLGYFNLEGYRNNAGQGFELVEFNNLEYKGASHNEDLDNDGVIEFIQFKKWEDSLFIYEIVDNTIHEHFQLLPDYWHNRAFFDLNHNGRSELIETERDYDNETFVINIYEYNSNLKKFETKTTSAELSYTATNGAPQKFIYFDYNNDGYDDLIKYTSSTIAGVFSTSYLLWEYNGSTLIYKGDLNNFIDYNASIAPKEHLFIDTKNGKNRFLVSNNYEIYILNGEQKTDLTFCTYLDKNENNQKDADENYISSSDIKITKNQNTNSYITKNSGCAIANLSEDRYRIDINPINCLTNNNNDSIDIVLDSLYEFPLVVDNEEGAVVVDITRAHSRCSFLSHYWIQVFNNTCSDFSGDLDVFIEENSTDIEPIIGGELIEPNTLRYHIENLQIGGKVKFEALIKMPSADFFGDVLHDNYFLTDSIGEEISFDTSRYVLRCAYDPNDKSIQPDRSEEYGDQYILNEDLEYLIRFENVGNDSAINIKVIDTISEYLNIETLEIISTSHQYRYSLNTQSRVLTVFFDDIYLPDNKTNEPEAHGFIKLKITPIEGLSEFTKIDNAAQIYFDFNPPIFTNTTQSIYVSDLSLLSSTFTQLQNSINIYPNPTKDILTIKSMSGEQIKSIYIFTINGELVGESHNINSDLNISHLRSGIYVLNIITPSMTSVHKVIKM